MNFGYTTIHQACLEQGVDLGTLGAIQLGDTHTTGAGTFRAERWNAYSEGGGGYQYQIAGGDTLSALAALYLDSAARWQEIWNLQSAERRAASSPDEIWADEWMEMPIEAGENARKLNGGQPLPGTAGQGGSKGKGGGTEPGDTVGWSTNKKLAVAGAVAGGLLLIYLVTR